MSICIIVKKSCTKKICVNGANNVLAAHAHTFLWLSTMNIKLKGSHICKYYCSAVVKIQKLLHWKRVHFGYINVFFLNTYTGSSKFNNPNGLFKLLSECMHCIFNKFLSNLTKILHTKQNLITCLLFKFFWTGV